MESSFEAQNLRTLLTVYKELADNPVCEKIIRESGLCSSTLMAYGEFLFIPLQLVYYPNTLNRFDLYSLRFQEPDIIDSAVLATDAFAYTILHNIVCNDKNQEINNKYLNLWGYIKDNHINDSINDGFLDAYKKLMYLFTSMVSTGIIKSDSPLTRHAFLLEVWGVVYKMIYETNIEYVNIVNQAITSLKECRTNSRYSYLYDEMQSKGFDVDCFDQQFAIKILFDMLNYKRDQIIRYICDDTYHHDHNILFTDSSAIATKIVDIVIEKSKQRAYINSLLYRENRPRLGITATDSMNPYTFEKLITLIFSKLGYDATTTKASGDQGIDVIAEKPYKRIAIQAKCYSNPVGNGAIQEAVAGKTYYKANEAYVVTNSTFTKSAIELAHANNVTLWDREILAQKLEELNVYADEI